MFLFVFSILKKISKIRGKMMAWLPTLMLFIVWNVAFKVMCCYASLASIELDKIIIAGR